MRYKYIYMIYDDSSISSFLNVHLCGILQNIYRTEVIIADLKFHRGANVNMREPPQRSNKLRLGISIHTGPVPQK